MNGILQMYDVDASIGYDRAEQERRDRSKSLGRELSEGTRSLKAPRSPAVKHTDSLPVLASVKPLGAGGLEGIRNGELNDSF